MEVRILYFERCPHARLARERVAHAAGDRPDVHVVTEPVRSPEEAERVGLRGSPTILVDGIDPFSAPDTPVSWSCRLYRSGHRNEGAPSVEQLRAVLRH